MHKSFFNGVWYVLKCQIMLVAVIKDMLFIKVYVCLCLWICMSGGLPVRIMYICIFSKGMQRWNHLVVMTVKTLQLLLFYLLCCQCSEEQKFQYLCFTLTFPSIPRARYYVLYRLFASLPQQLWILVAFRKGWLCQVQQPVSC